MTDSKGVARREAEFLLYAAPDGAVKVRVLFKDETAWLTQKALAELFGVKVPAINKHLNNIFESEELSRVATVSKMEIVQSEGGRKVTREVELYNLDAIIAVGYRVNSYQAHAIPHLGDQDPARVHYQLRRRAERDPFPAVEMIHLATRRAAG